MDNPQISIILPTYNVEQYISQCLDSILNQTYQNFEIIIIIDGATDNSFEIAQKYAKKDERITVIYQENAGSGPARNNGLKYAKGELVMFVDPDDWLGEKHLENLVNEYIIGDYDLIASFRTLIYFSSTGSVIKKEVQNMLDIKMTKLDKIQEKYFDFGSFIKSPTNKLYKRSLIEEHGICFPELRRSQDIVFNYRYFEKIQSLRVIPIADYNYRILYTERLQRLKKDYYLTTIFMFKDLKCMFDRLNLQFPITKACNYFFDDIMAIVETYASKDLNVSCVINDSTIKYIIKNSTPHSAVKKLQKLILLSRNSNFIIKFFKFKNRIKVNLNS